MSDLARDCTVRLATTGDYSYVWHLQRRWSNDVGYICRTAWMRYLDAGQVILCCLHGDPAGYILYHPTKRGLVRLLQIAITPDLLRNQLGTMTHDALAYAARSAHCSVIRATNRLNSMGYGWCSAYGYIPTAAYLHPTARRLALQEWTYPLVPTPDPRNPPQQHQPALTPAVIAALPPRPLDLPRRSDYGQPPTTGIASDLLPYPLPPATTACVALLPADAAAPPPAASMPPYPRPALTGRARPAPPEYGRRPCPPPAPTPLAACCGGSLPTPSAAAAAAAAAASVAKSCTPGSPTTGVAADGVVAIHRSRRRGGVERGLAAAAPRRPPHVDSPT
jgi:hypothetical protein